MRALSDAYKTALNAQETGETIVWLVTVTHADLPTPARFCSNPATRVATDPPRYVTVSRGQTYNFLPMAIVAPDDSDEAPPTIRLTLDNIGRELIALLRSTAVPAKVTMEIVLASAPDAVEVTWPEFDLVNAEYTAESVVVDLGINALATEPFPSGSFTPASFGGLF